MLFDLQGRRKNVIRVIYAFLALLMGGGLVLLGIGGDASGGLLNAVGLGDDGSTPADPAFERQIDSANETLATNPKDEKALLTLARVHYLAGNNAIETDEQGAATLTEDSISEYNAADDAWQKYLATNPQKPDDGVASLMVQLYASLAGSNTSATDPPAAPRVRRRGGADRRRRAAEPRHLHHACDLRLPRRRHQARRSGAQGRSRGGDRLDDQAAGHPAARSGGGAGEGDRQEHREERPRSGAAREPARRPRRQLRAPTRRLIEPRSERPAALATITDPGH